MPVEVSLNTPLADALTAVIQPKLVEAGWAGDASEAAPLSEYVILMLVNGKTQEEISKELSTELLGLAPDDPSSHQFAQWLFEQINGLNAQLNGGGAQQPGADAPQGDAATGEMDTDMSAADTPELNAPTGPKSMRNGNMRGGRERRMVGQMSKAMDRSGDAVLHRIRGPGGERINTHGRGPPTGPRGGMRGGRGNFNNNRAAANIQHGLAGMGSPAGPMMMNGMNGPPGNGMDVYAILEQQSQMMMQMSQQLMNNRGGHHNNRRGGKSLFDRVQDPNNRHHRGGHHQHHSNNGNNGRQQQEGQEGATGGDDMDMSGEKREPPNPEDTVCKYNLSCTNRECKFAHQSPAAPPGAHVDVNDVCSFGAACKNRKCVGRHPSPAAKLAHQSEQDCKFFPNCQNPRCPFRHPAMPLCRNGADCTTPNCKFTHVRTKCKFNPCLNRSCAFMHDEGQQGGFKDKVWTAEGGNEHVSDRKFVEDGSGEELIKPEDESSMAQDAVETHADAQDAEVIS